MYMYICMEVGTQYTKDAYLSPYIYDMSKT